MNKILHKNTQLLALLISMLSMLSIIISFSCYSATVEKKISVFTGIIPIKYFVDRISEGKILTNTVIGEGQNHETYEPTPKQMEELNQAQIYFSIGFPFEKILLKKFHEIHSKMLVVELEKSIFEFEKSLNKSKSNHQDPHLWLNPLYMKIVASKICDVLLTADKNLNNQLLYKKNLQKINLELTTLHNELDKRTKSLAVKHFMVYHEAFGHFAKLYGLEQLAIEEHGKEPGAKDLMNIIKLARTRKIKVILTQKQYNKKQAEMIASTVGAKIVDFNPLEYDYINNMKKLISILER
ncbi:MAG: zinc ABC transporter substrate-binding protein [Oligoflexia bacterium]|nr:zinc ABC transporter substrate-binding protein [Oligoflexia bacterium]